MPPTTGSTAASIVPASPNLSAAVQAQMAATQDKLLKIYKTPPYFNYVELHTLVPWIEAIEQIFQYTGITESNAKIHLALQWIIFKSHEILQHLSAVQREDYTGFLSELKGLFPHVQDNGQGSVKKLMTLIEGVELIRLKDKGKFKLFNMLFGMESVKLMAAPPILTNRDAIQLYVMTFNEEARKEIKKRAFSNVKNLKGHRKEDIFMIEEIREATSKVIGRDTFNAIYSVEAFPSKSILPLNAHSFQRNGVALPFPFHLPKTDYSYLCDLKCVKSEELDADGAVNEMWKAITSGDRDMKESVELG